MNRRTCLATLSTGALATIAGCTALPLDREDAPDPPPAERYPRLTDVAVYRAPTLGLGFPEVVELVGEPAAAALVVLPADTAVATETAVGWLAEGTRVALVGDGAQATFLEWLDSAAYREAFPDAEGGARSEPPPDVLVARPVRDEFVDSSRFTWAESPTDEDVLEALDEALGD